MEIEVKQLVLAIQTIADEKNLDAETVHNIVQEALASAYKRDFGDREQNVTVDLNSKTGDFTVFTHYEVVDEVEDDAIQMTLEQAKEVNKEAKVGEEVVVIAKPTKFGRVAAQTAKQVIVQRLRESEREIILDEYEDKIGTVLNGVVTRVEARLARVDLGKAQGILPGSEQIRNEYLSAGQRIKVYLKDVERTGRGPQLILSRGNTAFIEYLFENEVPEMENGAVEIKKIAREAGIRTKLAVHSTVPGVDPVGTFVGGHGTRVQAVMSEIGDDEKIDIIPYNEDIITFIANALAPTNVDHVELNEKIQHAKVFVKPDQQSVAIGRGGQNVRLASKLTGWELDITPVTGKEQPAEEEQVEEAKPAKPEPAADAPKKKFASKKELESNLLNAVDSQE